ncbi:Peptide methionine sulfoxide reductase B5 [Coemansia sp. BCRC 34301]|nr:Peptide methionine sulfoxide reductase B5 [Coemansia sp. BCRC 34301]
MPESGAKAKTNDEWRAILSPEQFRVLREKGTEAAGSGKYNKHTGDGVYECGACGTPLYTSTTKFDSGCGWPAFFDAIPHAVRQIQDTSHGMTRTEIVCSKCSSHLGHVFKGEGFKVPTNERHCVNSISLTFTDKNATKSKDKE